MAIINLFIKLILSIAITYLILTNYKRIKFNKKYALVLFALGIVLFCIDVVVKTTFIPKTIISTIILSILNPIEVAIWIYVGIYIVNKMKRFKNR